MAGDWVSMRTNLATDPRVVRMAARLKVTRTAVVGAFWALWSAASEHGEEGRIPDADADTIDYLTETPGFAAAAVAAKWLEFDADGALCPRWSEHNDGSSAKVRARERDKKRRQRKNWRRVPEASHDCPPSVPECPGDKSGQGGDTGGTCAGHVSHTDTDTDTDKEKSNTSASDGAKPPPNAAATPPGPRSLKFTWTPDAGFVNLPESVRMAWERAYPACDVDAELAKAHAWMLANPTKRKSNWTRFVGNWLARAQDRGGSNPSERNNRPEDTIAF